MVSSGLLRRVALFVTLMKEAPGSSETTVLTRATRRNNPEDTILDFYIPEDDILHKEAVYRHFEEGIAKEMLSLLTSAVPGMCQGHTKTRSAWISSV
jgi:hypothetical protein